MKKKIIFLDIDGVLNGYNFWSLFGWYIFRISSTFSNWYRNKINPSGIHEKKVKRLAKIIQNTNAKVVMSSSWRIGFWDVSYEEKIGRQKVLADMLNKYNIDVIDITPYSNNGRREDEIIAWLSRHEDEVESFVILDDERSDLQCFVGSNLVQTSSVPRGKMIMGHWYENTGLKNKHVKKAIKILNEKRSLER